MKQFVTIKVWKDTRRLANIVRAHTGESLVALLHRLVVHKAREIGLPTDTKFTEPSLKVLEDSSIT